jgi:hypothetical protein
MDVLGFIFTMVFLGTIATLTIYYMIKFFRIINGSKENSQYLRKHIVKHLLVVAAEALVVFIYHSLK